MDSFELIFGGLAILYYFFIEVPRRNRRKRQMLNKQEGRSNSEKFEQRNQATSRRTVESVMEKSPEEPTIADSTEAEIAAKKITTAWEKRVKELTQEREQRDASKKEHEVVREERSTSTSGKLLFVGDLRSAIIMNEVLSKPISLR